MASTVQFEGSQSDATTTPPGRSAQAIAQAEAEAAAQRLMRRRARLVNFWRIAVLVIILGGWELAAPAQQFRQPGLHARRAGFPEQTGHVGRQPVGRAQHAMAGHRLRAADHGVEGLGDVEQPLAQRHLRQRVEQLHRHFLLAVRPHGGGEQAVLVAEVAVDGELGDTGRLRDLVHADAIEPVFGEEMLGGLEHGRALGRVLGTAEGGTGGGQGIHAHNNKPIGSLIR